jgi:hypothetical protein
MLSQAARHPNNPWHSWEPPLFCGASLMNLDRHLYFCIDCRKLPDARAPYVKMHGTGHRPWLAKLLERRPTRVAAVVLANKLTRMAWAMMVSGEVYGEPVASAR